MVFANPREAAAAAVAAVVVWSTKMSDPTLKFAKQRRNVYTSLAHRYIDGSRGVDS